MGALEIVLIVLAVVVALFFVFGVLGARRRDREQAPAYAEHVAAADQSLEQARALDRGWDRPVMEEAARRAIADSHADWRYDHLHLVLVDDQPGVDEDRAHFVAMDEDREVRVVLARRGGEWVAERVE